MKSFLQQKFWIFDMDGTLTIAAHDFPAMHRMLDIPDGQGILEALGDMPREQSAPLRQKLDDFELELAKQSRRAEGVLSLLQHLQDQGVRMGILTRNSEESAYVTLKATGIDSFFAKESILGRSSAEPKPNPEGIHLLLEQWQAKPEDAVMVGDHIFDLQAGKGAGTGTIYIDVNGEFPFREYADVCLQSFTELFVD